MQATVRCGLKGQNESGKVEAVLDPVLGHPLRITRDDEEWFAADTWDSDTPCVFYMSWYNPARKERLLALAKDLLAMATPERVAKRTLEVVVAAKDGTADEPTASLGVWASQKPALEALLPLPEGLPKVVDSGMHPRLPQGKKYLALAYCPPLSFRGMSDLYALAFPNVSYHVVEAPTVSCPTVPEGWELGRPTVVSLGKRELRAGILQRKNPTPEESPFARAVVMLVDRATGSVLDWKRLDFQWGEADMPTTRVTDCRVFAEAGKGTLSVTRSCAWDGTYETCEQDPLEAVSDIFSAKADKLAVRRTTEMTPGRRCEPID